MIFGILLIALGVWAYTATKAPTGLIPAYFGAVLAICGVMTSKVGLRMHVMHVAALVGLLGTLGGLGMGLPKLLKGAESIAPKVQVGMGVLSLIFLVLCIRSFIAARKARQG